MARKKLTVNPPAVLATTVPYVPQTPVSKEQLGKMREEALAYFRSEATYYGHGMVPPFNVAARVEGILGAVDLESARVALQKAKSAGLMSLLAAWATKKIPGPDTSENWKNGTVTDDLSKREAKFDTTTYGIRNLWTQKDIGTTKDVLTAEVPGHDVLMLRLNKL